MILILTGPVRDYKTSTLKKWCEGRKDCGGVLSPDIEGLRVLYNIRNGKSITWQKKLPESDADIVVGKFTFDPEAFQTARHWLDDHLHDPAVRYIILDEVGRLEIEGKGWASWLQSSLPNIGSKTLILVVRRNLLDEVIHYFGLGDVSVVEKEYFEGP